MRTWTLVMLLVLLTGGLTGAAVIDEQGIEIAARSPDGAFRVEKRWKGSEGGERTDSYDVFVVPERGPRKSAVLLEEEVDATQDRHFEVSPDGRWIFSQWKCYTRRSSCELFERKDGLRFARVIPSLQRRENEGGFFDQAIWEFFQKTTNLGFEDYPRLVDFVAWAPDSSRLLIAIRGSTVGEGVASDSSDKEEDVEGPGIFDWKVYWNTRTRLFEITPVLTANNADADKRWGGNANYERLFQPYCAEPVGPLLPLPVMEAKLKRARAAFDQTWNTAQERAREEAKRERESEEDSEKKPWSELESAGKLWRQRRIAELESTAEQFSQHFPEKARPQWRALSLTGGYENAKREVENGEPWR